MTAIQKLRDMVDYFNERVETVNGRFRSIKDLETVYDYEQKHEVWDMSQDERLYHSENVNCILNYKVYSTTQTIVKGKVTKPNYSSFHP